MNLSLRRERSEILVAPFSKMLLSLEKALRKHPFLSQETKQPVEKVLAELTNV